MAMLARVNWTKVESVPSAIRLVGPVERAEPQIPVLTDPGSVAEAVPIVAVAARCWRTAENAPLAKRWADPVNAVKFQTLVSLDQGKAVMVVAGATGINPAVEPVA